MNRNKSLGVRNNIKGNQEFENNNNNFRAGDLMRMSDFDDFDSMFDNFAMPRIGGGLFGNFQSISRHMQDLESEMFSNVESFGGSNNGTFISKSYVSKVKYDQHGQPHKETYHTQSISQTDKNGKRIKEKQQAYQNSKTGIQKAAHERMLDDKGHKVVKARNRNTGEDYEHTLYKGMREDDLDIFNNEYSDYRQKVNFNNNYKILQNIGSRRILPESNTNPLMIGSGNENRNTNFNTSTNDSYNRLGLKKAR